MTESVQEPPRPRGRIDKREAILDAATDLFLEGGYAAASMDAIATRAEVSKQTIYHHFGCKDGLFGAIINRRCDGLLSPFLTPETKQCGIEAALTSLARQFLELLLNPTSLALYRVLIAEAHRDPELGRISYAAGPQVAVRTLTDYIAEQAEAGRLAVGDPRIAAEQFFGMLTGHLQLRALLGVEERPDFEHTEEFIANAIRTFLAAHQPAREEHGVAAAEEAPGRRPVCPETRHRNAG
jgi:TetR/AcrR family transcriptional repressor of mexJK operon